MDFNDTPAEAQFRTEARAWLAQNASQFATADEAEKSSSELNKEHPYVQRAIAWQQKKAEANWSAIHWPKEYGGRGGTPMETIIFRQEEEKFNTPKPAGLGLGMCGPTIIVHGTEEQKQRYLPKIITGEEIWCQLFSEPSAGSDAAAYRTRAVRDGTDWIINGQKVWTSNATYSDFGILVARHDPSLPKHQGLTYFIVDMKTPGIKVQPIKQITGESHFCEVFFSDVRIADSQRVGAVGDGWRVALTTLMNERLVADGFFHGSDIGELWDFLREYTYDGEQALQHPLIREKIADWYVQTRGVRHFINRTLTKLSQGGTPGPEASLIKIVTSNKLLDIGSFGMDLLGESGILIDEPEVKNSRFPFFYLLAPGLRVAGGTDEILRNIIGERVLGLPSDIRLDKGIPFKDIPSGNA